MFNITNDVLGLSQVVPILQYHIQFTAPGYTRSVISIQKIESKKDSIDGKIIHLNRIINISNDVR